MKYLVDFFRTILPQGLARLRFNMVWALLSLIIGLTHTGVVMALLAFKLISETVALAVLDHSLSLTVVLCIIGALFPSKTPHAKKDPPPTDEP
ncbi:MAG: hypothetical protein DI626_00260 [Micavibrio aeruginosavorus]|uniref:Uncharacterized protein n=1 Tax=Micavibrio aeruginosavorus TaxID=349221 RepID=A0A2W5C4E5_9BACT|nr:MAG: hypothetical protein DI626_00260 [Micavibrio aeruginosavorus]